MPDLRTPIGARAPASAIFEPSYIEPNTSHDQSKFSTSQTPTVVGSSDGAFILKGIGSSTMTASDGCSGHNLGPIESPAMRKFNFSHFQRSPSAQAIPINSDVVVTEGSEERHAEGPGARSLHNLSSQASPNTGIPSTTHITGHAVEHMKIPPDSSNALNPPTSTVLSSRALEDLLRSIKSLNFPSLSGNSNRSSASAMSPSQLRDLLLPTLAKNAQRRPGFNDLPITKVENGLREALTDRVCETLSQKLMVIRRQMQGMKSPPSQHQIARSAADVHTAPSCSAHPPASNAAISALPASADTIPEPPRAPRAMRDSRLGPSNYGSMESISFVSETSSSDILKDDSRGRSQWPTGYEPTDSCTPLVASKLTRPRSMRWDVAEEPAPSKGIHNPLDSQFFSGAPIRPIKRESPSPSKHWSTRNPRVNPSRSPRGRSPSLGSRHSSRRPPYHSPLGSLKHRRSPSRSHSRSRQAHSPLAKRRRHSFSRSRSPVPSSHSFVSRNHGSPVPRRAHSPIAHHRRSRSADFQRASFSAQNDSFKQRPPAPVRRRTPVHMRAIDRTRPSYPPSQKVFISGQPSLLPNRVSQASIPSENYQPRRSPSPSRRGSLVGRDSYKHISELSRSPLPAKYRRHKHPSSPSRTRSPSPVRASFRHHLSRAAPDKNHHGLLELKKLGPSPLPHISHRDSIETGAMPVLNDEKKKQPPSSAKVPPIKREPDDEDFVTALHPSSAVPPSASLIPAITTFVSHHDNAPPCPAPSSPADTSMEKASPIGPAAPMVQVPASDFAPTSQIQSPIIAYPATETLARSPNQLSHAPAETPSASLVIPASPLPPRVPLTLSATSPPPDISTSRPSFALPSQRTPPHSTMAIETMPCHNIPGLWLMQVGHEQADVVDCEFEVDSEIAEKWHLSGESTDSLDSTERLSLRLLCLPKELAQDFYQMGAIPKPDALVSVPTTWPEQGSLIVQMNPTKPYRQSWLPEHMGPTSPGIDMTNYVRQGTNVLRLIQLDDMTDKIFVLQAELLPPPEEQSLSAFWHAATHNLSDPVWNLLPATVEVM